jgi:A/G-specific adenine glycosylase
VMLQQTRIETVIPYFEKWMFMFPDLASVSNSNEEEILRIWEGLGYYSRARNIYKTAKIIMEDYQGVFPRDKASLRRLPGIGEYITGAILSIAFHEKMPALDGNAIRVIARLFNYQQPVNVIRNRNFLKKKLVELLPEKKPGDFNQALMDLGSLICIPPAPKCDHCPLKKFCESYKNATQDFIPIKEKKKHVPHYQVVAAIIKNEIHEVLIDKRPSEGLLGGLWEFPGGKVEKMESHEEALIRELKEELGILVRPFEEFGIYKHAYTHFRVTVHTYLAKLNKGQPKPVQVEECKWVRVEELNQYPMGKVDRNISKDLQKRCHEFM